jgi:hypothetical protein
MTDDLTEFMPQEAIDESIASTQRIAMRSQSLCGPPALLRYDALNRTL